MKFITKPSLELGLLLGFIYNCIFDYPCSTNTVSALWFFHHSSGRPYLFYPLCPDMPAVPAACNFSVSCQKWGPWPLIILWGVSLSTHKKTKYFCVFSVSREHTQTAFPVQLDVRRLQTHAIPNHLLHFFLPLTILYPLGATSGIHSKNSPGFHMEQG